jgi:hypothetical protein
MEGSIPMMRQEAVIFGKRDRGGRGGFLWLRFFARTQPIMAVSAC